MGQALRRPMRRLGVAVLVAGCAAAGEGGSDAGLAEQPLVGVDGSTDGADRSCHIVLRELGRNWTGATWESVPSSSGSAVWVMQGTLEISEAAAAEGLVPHALYRLGSGQWTAVAGEPSPAEATPGFARFTVRLVDGLPGPGWSGSAIANAKVQVAPFLALPQGGRLFDHNRNPSDFDDYVLTSPDFVVRRDPAVCQPPAGPQRARLVFAADYSERREGVIAPGGELAIVYDTNRLTTCRHSRGGSPLWEMTAHVQFETGAGPIKRTASVRDAAATMAVPPTATGVTIWFENTSASGCQAWDSNLGANYHWDAARPPQWMGEARSLITRGASDPCDGGVPSQNGFSFDTWARQRAAITNLCFQVYEPNVTDRDDPDLWQKLDVSLRYRYAGETAWRQKPINLDRRVGNNARFAASWRDMDPFKPYTCPPVQPRRSADGQYVSLDVEYYLVVNGGELRPAPGAAYVGNFLDYLHDPWRDSNCD